MGPGPQLRPLHLPTLPPQGQSLPLLPAQPSCSGSGRILNPSPREPGLMVSTPLGRALGASPQDWPGLPTEGHVFVLPHSASHPPECVHRASQLEGTWAARKKAVRAWS